MPTIDPAALAAEIRTDPKGIGFAPLVAAGDHAAIAAALMALAGPGGSAAVGAETVTLARVSKAAFLAWLTMPCLALAGKLPDVQAKWDRLLSLARAHDGEFDVPVLMPQLQAMKGDGLTTDAGIAALTTRIGSRLEVLFEAGAVTDHAQVSVALGG